MRQRRGRGIHQAHYPSWGSGTVTAVAAPPTQQLASLPLMGIGNAHPDGDSSRLEHLITPHGDREPLGFNPGNHQPTENSLPLMGIGNRPIVTWLPSSPASHYPSWGSGTVERTAATADDDNNSLPLMGIGNAPTHGTGHHGHRQTHYPSWGSGTCNKSIICMKGFNGAHYPSWGSGTGQRVAGLTNADHLLITPHGDREPP